jgi:hypothetical protein
MSRSVKWVLGCGFVVAVLCGFLYLELLGPAEWRWSSQIRQGNHLVAQIESYRKMNGHLPSELTEIGQITSEAEPFFYERCSDTKYILWFGTELGESMTYNSSLRQWREINDVCP